MTHSYVGHDSFVCKTRLIPIWDMTHSYVGHDSLVRAQEDLDKDAVSHALDIALHVYIGHDSFVCGA